MVEVFTIGGGEYIVNTFNAVAAWTATHAGARPTVGGSEPSL